MTPVRPRPRAVLLALARRFVGEVGGDLARTTIRRGHREFVG